MGGEMSTTRQTIISHATEAFLEAPYTRVSVREISTRSGYSNTYVHHLFGSKREIFMAVCRDAEENLRQALNMKPDDPPAVTALKLVSVNPLKHPMVRLISRTASDSDMLEALIEHWNSTNQEEGKGSILLGSILSPAFEAQSSGHSVSLFPGSSIQVSPATFAVLGLCIIWSPHAAAILGGLWPERKAELQAAPQEILLAFIQTLTALGLPSEGKDLRA